MPPFLLTKHKNTQHKSAGWSYTHSFFIPIMHYLNAMDVQAVDNRSSCSAVISNPEEWCYCQLYKHVLENIRVVSVLNKAPGYPELWERKNS